MKGRLYKIENEWKVRYTKYDLTNRSVLSTKFDEDYFETLPVIDNGYVNGLGLYESNHGVEVEFEIVEQFMPYDNFKPIHKFAKLII